MKQAFFNKSVDESLNELNSNPTSGLTDQEVTKRLANYGENKLQGKKEKSIYIMFLEQFKDYLVIILIVAAIVSALTGNMLEGVIIIAIVIINAILGVYQEFKAGNALKALEKLSSPLAKIMRNGKVAKIESNLIVPGDIVVIEAGDYVPADLRLIETINLKIDESALTGESVSSEKHAEKVLPDNIGIGDKTNCAFMGTVVTYGRAKGVIANTGMQTEMGNIALALSNTEESPTPLQVKLNSLGKYLGTGCLAICAIIFLYGYFVQGQQLTQMFMTAIALAVAAIPEGLTIVVTVILTMGMQRLVKVNAIVKKLNAVETLGSATVICSDKTGTLTQNKMTVTKIFDGKSLYDVTGTGYNIIGEIIPLTENRERSITTILRTAVLCNDSIYNEEKGTIIGDPTEGALLVLAAKKGIEDADYKKRFPRIQEIPFDSKRKLMSSFHSIHDTVIMCTKGAPDEILRKCTKWFDNGNVVEMTDEEKEIILKKNDEFAGSALRVLGFAYKEATPNDSPSAEQFENDLIFLGLTGMIDPPRDEVKEAIATCKKAGINVKMITGDHLITACAIAEQIGILTDDKGITGRELDEISDAELKELVKTTNVFARVSPEHKVRLVEAIKSNGDIVAMTGDGVNDAPSLKRADIGIAMGITGTDVSKEAADMILTDDNFATIVKSVEEGRTIYNNLRKVIAFLLSCNIGEILLIFFAMLLNFPSPLNAIQLLSINLITDAFPAFALGMEKKESGIMDTPPRDPNEPIVGGSMKWVVGIQSIAVTIGCLASFAYGYLYLGNKEVAMTMCFVTLVVEELLRAYSSRSEKESIFNGFFSNSFLNKSVFVSLVFLMLAVYVPFLQPIFKTVPLSFSQFFPAIGFSLIPIIVGEVFKSLFIRKMIENGK